MTFEHLLFQQNPTWGKIAREWAKTPNEPKFGHHLATQAGILASSTTRTLGRWVELGLCERVEGPERPGVGRPRQYYGLTSQGKAALAVIDWSSFEESS